MKIKHYSLFNNELEKINWNVLREDIAEPHYFVPKAKKAYLERVQKPELFTGSIQQMINKIQELGCKKVFSLGCGIATNEYQIVSNSNLRMIVSDNTESIKRLQNFDIFEECLFLDMLNDEYIIDEDTIVLLHRIDTEFNDEDLVLLFEKLTNYNTKYICFVPVNPKVLSILLNELKTLMLSILKSKKRTLCGLARSKSSLVKLWKNKYEIVYEYSDEITFYLLKII